ncbi:MAG TPA: DUF6445 family protein [Steroidobacteraceae bacterium]|nr:DUF6445 family protein [Steroidobacteraceae bacterium]
MLDLDGKLRLHDEFTVATRRIGDENEPVAVIDNFLSDPELLIEYAAARCGFDGVSDTFYPGSRAVIPPIYCFALRAFLGGIIGETFGLGSSAVTGELAHFSLVTTPPDKLNVLQRMPHFDSTSPKQLAVLHFLCGREHGGTSFYRHRRTGFEFVDAARSRAYGSALEADLAAFGTPPAKYICGDDLMFERTASISAAFNRVIIYRSINLHSADIGAAFRFDSNPQVGRLTANTFFFYR